jgi:hypothetical protein
MSAMNLESARLHATCIIRIGQIAIDAAGAWCKCQNDRIYSVLVSLNNGPYA